MTGLESLATQGVHVLSFSKDVERKFQRCGEEIPKMWRGVDYFPLIYYNLSRRGEG